MTRTPLHTRPETINEYRRIACELLDSLRNDAHAMQESNERVDNSDAINLYEVRDQELAQRLDLESWTTHTTQLIRDAMYLLALGDNGPTAASDADPEGASKQAHAQRRIEARERLIEQGLLSDRR